MRDTLLSIHILAAGAWFGTNVNGDHLAVGDNLAVTGDVLDRRTRRPIRSNTGPELSHTEIGMAGPSVLGGQLTIGDAAPDLVETGADIGLVHMNRC